MPSPTDRTAPKNEKPVILFPSSTVGRKGCYELREALIGLNVKLLTLGPHIEGADFWNGFDVERGGEDWLQMVDIVVLPAFIEHKPRRLLLAAASGIPVIASRACGVNDTPGIRTVDAGDVVELAAAIREMLCLTAK
jgi:glycosyltransferase involved in cell wall biosynthesis